MGRCDVRGDASDETFTVARGERTRADDGRAARDARALAMLVRARMASPAERQRLEALVVGEYLDVAHAIANRFGTRLVDGDDLRQVACLGLVKAVRRFDPERHHDVVAFAVPTISGEIKRHLRDGAWVVRPPRRLQDLSAEVRRSGDELAQELGREPLVAELAAATGRTADEVREARACATALRPDPLDAPHPGDEDEGDRGPAARLAEPDDPFERVDRMRAIACAARVLGERDRRILYLRFFRDWTQEEIARECGVSQVQISRRLAEILRRLRGQLAPLRIAADRGERAVPHEELDALGAAAAGSATTVAVAASGSTATAGSTGPASATGPTGSARIGPAGPPAPVSRLPGGSPVTKATAA